MTTTPAATTTAPSPDGPRPGDVVRDSLAGGRETVESIIVAFVLALLFRGFEAEAFVIPTGSMAPTLMGRHKDLSCSSCGEDFRVGCSQEWDEGLGRVRADKLVSEARCPNCGNVMPLTVRQGQYDSRYPSFSGDRILVDKFAYDFAEPERWDVVVFKYPEDAKTNYIKRLVGLPGETVLIAGGDIWTSRDGADPVIARKSPTKLRAMLQTVHDSRHPSPELAKLGWPAAWSDWAAAAGGGSHWQTTDDGRSFSAACAAGGAAELRYRHFLPSPGDWRQIRAGRRPDLPDTASLIDDFQPYNTHPTRLHHVGDLAVETTLESRSTSGRVTFDLVEEGQRHRLEIDLADGTARLHLPGAAAPVTAATPVRGRGRWTILFANVDDELSLDVNGRRIVFSGSTSWQRPLPLGRPAVAALPVGPGDDTVSDLAPVGVRVADADVAVSGLRVLRDVYYIPAVNVERDGRVIEDKALEFALRADEFFMLGDNSAASKDSRLWLSGHHVDRRLLIGKAMVVFWPHAIPASWSIPVKFGSWELRLPCWPNFGRMRFVR
jgi:signal peptidase I